MIELRLPTPASTATLQLALTRALESANSYRHATGIARSARLKELCLALTEERESQANRIARLIENEGGTPDLRLTWEAGFQQLWMTLVDRRAPDSEETLPRECERGDRRLERVLMRLWHDPATGASRRRHLGVLLREVRGGFQRLPQFDDARHSLTAG
ncbi:DUF2383 domain-containing protein [Luteolibacter marinus]|uniref:DUF2383 domain-containing protein n=1 Tax=Luteolibacter marinus TaxID=2776705 RepID=UPI001866D588|nr:DUF2383 domain-containing protein [Luteolibacter marinus]